MRILLQNSLFFPNVIGGAEVSTHVLGAELRRRGHRVDALATTGRRGSGRSLQSRPTADNLGVVLEAPSHGLYDLLGPQGVPGTASLPVRALHHLGAVRSQRWLRLCRQALDATNPHIVHTNTLVGMTPVIWQAAAERGIPVVHTLRDYHLLCPRTTLLRSTGRDCTSPPLPCRLLARWKLALTATVAVVTAPSRFVLERHLQAGGFPAARAEVVPNAAEEPPAQAPDRRERARVTGLYLGQLDRHKGVLELIAALQGILADGRDENLDFAFAGAGPCGPAVQEFCRRSGGRASWLGVVRGRRKQEALAQADFVVVPSIWQDNFPRALLDAFAWGLPVIASRRGGIPEVVGDGVQGLLIEPCARDLAAALRLYARDPRLRLTHGEAARRRAADFTLSAQADRFEQIYASLLA